MADTPKIKVTEVAVGQAQKEVTANSAFRRLEQGSGLFVVIDRNVTSPPGSPTDGDAYIVASAATGGWSGQDLNIAYDENGAWQYVSVFEGLYAFLQDENILVRYNGTAWVRDTGVEIASGTISGVTISSSNVDATPIGNTTPDSGAFTSLIFSSGTKTDGIQNVSSAFEVQTTSTLPTSVVVASVTLLDENTYHFNAKIVGVETDGSNRISQELIGTFYRTGGASAIQQGSTTVAHLQRSFTSAIASFETANNAVRVVVNGEASTTIEWGAILSFMNMSN